MPTTIIQVIASLAAVLVPALVAYIPNLPENIKYLVFGLFTGAVGGWWFCHFFSGIKTGRITAEKDRIVAHTARLAEENAEKQRQWERDRQDRADAEEAAERAKDAAEKEILEKAIKAIREKFEISFDGQLVPRDRTSFHRYCRQCGLGAGKAVKLQSTSSRGGWYCPECGWEKPISDSK